MMLSLAPLPLWMIIGFEQDGGIGFACWPVGLIVGLLGLREHGLGRKLAWVGILMNIFVPVIGFLLAPLFVGFMLSRSMP